jgi:murein DD-endopeptidase MepM/ murein hydrolase activator NlpD
MNQHYFVLEFAHSMHGRLKRVHITHRSLALLSCSLVVLSLLVFGLFSSYLRMTWKVSHYNQLRADFDRLRGRYQELQRVSRQHNEQMASLETLASEVSVAYGIDEDAAGGKRQLRTSGDFPTPDVKESMAEYNFLKAATLSSIYRQYPHRWQSHNQPSLWPVAGKLVSSFGERLDPFSGEGAFHTGMDFSVPQGTPVRVTADGVITEANWGGRYGKLVIVDHGNGVVTYYAHLSEFLVVPGQEVRRGEVIALSGGTGHSTAPHVHYEIRLAGTPVNPYQYLSNSKLSQPARPPHSDLGL